MVGAFVQAFLGDRAEHLDEPRDRVVGKVAVSGMALGAKDREMAHQAAAPADLDHIAQFLRVRRLADQADIERLPPLLEPIQHLDRAVDGQRLLVAGDQKADRAVEAVRAFHQEPGQRSDETGDGALHVGGAPAAKMPVDDLGAERVGVPAFGVAHRHHVGVSGETEIGRGIAEAGVKVGDIRRAFLRENQLVTGKAELFERRLEDIQRTGVLWRHRRAADQRPGQSKGLGRRCHSRNRSLIEVFERVCSSTCLTMTAQ